ncbi:MAG: ribonuclease HII [Oscillospiraceae bacterium]|nr:ribonuclease HII [Oscillospiraceae bacterium]
MAKKLLTVQTALFEFDADVRTHVPVFCGVDEAGRGPLAGDVYAAAVILQPDARIAGLNDSKKIPEARREDMVAEIKEKSVAWSIAFATVEEIERLNILQATMLAMRRAVEGLAVAPQLALIDGNQVPDLQIPTQSLIGGDAKSASIAAASVLAKTARDATLRELDTRYPMYGFAKHKGYGTKAHYDAIRQYGMCPAHRPSFLKKFYGNEQ